MHIHAVHVIDAQLLLKQWLSPRVTISRAKRVVCLTVFWLFKVIQSWTLGGLGSAFGKSLTATGKKWNVDMELILTSGSTEVDQLNSDLGILVIQLSIHLWGNKQKLIMKYESISWCSYSPWPHRGVLNTGNSEQWVWKQWYKQTAAWCPEIALIKPGENSVVFNVKKHAFMKMSEMITAVSKCICKIECVSMLSRKEITLKEGYLRRDAFTAFSYQWWWWL